MGRAIYFVREALRGFYHAKLMTMVSVLTVAVSLFVLGLGAVGALNVRRWFAQVSARPDVVAYVEERLGADSDALADLRERVAEFPQVALVKVIDKDEAWRRFQELYGSDMLEMVDENPLPASLDISVGPAHDTPRQVESLSRELEHIAGIESVDYSTSQLQALVSVGDYVWAGAALLAILCLLVLLFVVANTVKLTIYARRDLVVNMRFVGATDRFIETPFILEGILQGLFGGLIAVGAISVLRMLPLSRHVYWGPDYFFGTIVVLTGVIFAWVGSANAVRKFLV